MIRLSTKNVSMLVIFAVLVSSCGVSDYINRKKITKAVKKEPIKKEQAVKVTSSKCDSSEVRINRMVKYINRARAKKRNCGDEIYSPVQAVSWNTLLYNAASVHAQDMATHNLFSHTGSDNSSTGDRVSDTGYDWKAVAENISGGTDTPEQTIDRWLASPRHCHNIMNAIYTEIGMACVVNHASEYEIYWTLVLGHSQKQSNTN